MKELLEKLAELDNIDATTDPTPAEVKQLDEMAKRIKNLEKLVAKFEDKGS